jgi:hypothetical protein
MDAEHVAFGCGVEIAVGRIVELRLDGVDGIIGQQLSGVAGCLPQLFWGPLEPVLGGVAFPHYYVELIYCQMCKTKIISSKDYPMLPV